MKTGQSTTSFHPAMGNPIMTSSTYNLYADPATEESKTESSNELHGGTNASSSSTHKGWVVRILRGINDLLPRTIRPIKSKRAKRRALLKVSHYVFMFRMHWKSHYKNKIKKRLNLK